MIDLDSDRPAYRQLAEKFRTDIGRGRYRPGAAIPSEVALGQRYDVSRNTVRLAMGLLRQEGLVVTRQGRGTFVRSAVPVRRRAVSAVPPGLRTDATDREVRADTRVAGLLDVAVGTPVFERRTSSHDGGLPQETSASYVPLDLATAVFQRQPCATGTIAALASAGVEVTEIHELVRARMPHPDEARALAVPTGTPVFTITRTMYAGDRPVEAAVDIVLPADRVELAYRAEPHGRPPVL
ncbi:GntR family transcriptional regulator [Cryptosporangium sp. NPDC051539]|uniref:GntR family transcriptional regulator n=1 Tax=Cryptosporangium sp. NPDC051539 TaxID=3363962 RepID=UPI0037A98648